MGRGYSQTSSLVALREREEVSESSLAPYFFRLASTDVCGEILGRSAGCDFAGGSIVTCGEIYRTF